MSEQHTSTPWKVESCPTNRHARTIIGGIYVDNDGPDETTTLTATRVATVEGNPTSAPITQLNAERIVACVNFCAGVPDSTLAHTSLADTLVALNAADDLRRQRDELAVCLRELHRILSGGMMEDYDAMTAALGRASAALANCKP